MTAGHGGGDGIALLESRIDYSFSNKELAREALTHASHCNDRRQGCNERLEFLGDAVLELTVSSHLYAAYPAFDEGRLTRMRAAVVSEPSLARVAGAMDLGGLLVMGRGMEQTGGRQNPSILSDAVEAIIGAIYLDGGFERAKAFILPRLEDAIRAAADEGFLSDSKTRLQELLQKNGEIKIEYVLDDAVGPPHDRTFTMSVLVEGKQMARGTGRSKKDAQQQAAANALSALKQTTDESENK